MILVVSALVTLKHGNFSMFKNIVYYYDEDKLNEVAIPVFNMILNYDQSYKTLKSSLCKLLYSMIKQLKKHNEKYYASHLDPLIKSMLIKTSTFDFSSILPLFEAMGYLTYYLCISKSVHCASL